MTAMLLCLALCGAAPSETGAPLNIQADDDPTQVVVRYRIPPGKLALWREAIDKDAPEDPRKWLSLRLLDVGDKIDEADREGPPVFGTHEIRDGYVLFRPRFALARGAAYAASAHEPGGGRYLAWRRYDVPEFAPREPTRVESILPGTDVLPANLLKFQIAFSRPMRQGREVFERIHLYDHAGKEIPSPWRDIELWHVNMPTLMLYIHPGRIKQGVNLREELGPVLEPGGSYTLVVDAAMRDATGAPLGKEYRKSFKAGVEVRKKIDVDAWSITVPAAGTVERLVIGFDRPIDQMQIFGSVRIIDPAGKEFHAAGTYTPHHWLFEEFTPQAPWQAGTYRITVRPQLTDVAGNTPHTVFDRDLDDRSHDPTDGPIERTFTIR